MLCVHIVVLVLLCGHDVLLQLVVQHVKVECKFSHASGCKFVLGVYHYVGVVTLVHEEWSHASGGARSVVVGELCY